MLKQKSLWYIASTIGRLKTIILNAVKKPKRSVQPCVSTNDKNISNTQRRSLVYETWKGPENAYRLLRLLKLPIGNISNCQLKTVAVSRFCLISSTSCERWCCASQKCSKERCPALAASLTDHEWGEWFLVQRSILEIENISFIWLDSPNCYWDDLRTEPKQFSIMVSGRYFFEVVSRDMYIRRRANRLSFIAIRFHALWWLPQNFKPSWPWVATIFNEIQTWILQQGIALGTVLRTICEWITAWGVHTLPWPAKSLNINLIKNLKGTLARMVYNRGRQFDNLSSLHLLSKHSPLCASSTYSTCMEAFLVACWLG